MANGKFAQRGASMIEVLVTIVIISFGLLGLAGLQTRMQVSEMEAYQRAQALVMLSDMANRIQVNRGNAASYATGSTPIGPTTTCTSFSGSTVNLDKQEWCNALQGAAEMSGGNRLGSVIGGRGCIAATDVANEYMITIAWQGMVPISAPPASVTCGQNLYNGDTTRGCVNDLCRRTVTTVVRLAPLWP